eukprot:2009817-Amphidinium_carterae.3
MAECQEGESVEQLVLNFTSAFYQIPLHPSERRYFCAMLGSKIFVYLRLAQGSRLAPLNPPDLGSHSCTVRKLAGKCSQVSSVLKPCLKPCRPFLAELWGVVVAGPIVAQSACVYTRQFTHTLHWIQAFLLYCEGVLFRQWKLSTLNLVDADQVMALAHTA